jgi:CrcB protein
MTPLSWIGVAALGGVGAIARFLLDGAIVRRLGRDLPFGTFAVNLTGSFVLGFVTGVALNADALLLIGTATIGSYTTFSTWMLETHRLRQEGDFREGLGNIVLSLALGLGGVALGWTLGRHV